MSRALILLATLVLAGCSDPPQRTWVVDQCQRREAFKGCLAALPAGPQATKYNDWDEVVSECDRVAYHQSLRAIGQVKPECRAE